MLRPTPKRLRFGSKRLASKFDKEEPDTRPDLAPLEFAEDGLIDTKTMAAIASKTNNATRWPRTFVFRILVSVIRVEVKVARRVLFIEGKLPFEFLRLS